MMCPDWQVARWRETNDTARVACYQAHLEAGEPPHDALLAAALLLQPGALPPHWRRPPQTAAVSPAEQGLLTLLCAVPVALLALAYWIGRG